MATTGPPLNLLLLLNGTDNNTLIAALNTNAAAINAWAAGLGNLQVAKLIGTPDGVSVNTFVSPFVLADTQGKSYAVIYNNTILSTDNTQSLFYTVSGPNNTVITFNFFPEVGADLRIMVI